MANPLAFLFGGKPRPPDPNPLPGVGGYAAGEGPYGEHGYPGSTVATRTFRGASPRRVKLRTDALGGWEGGMGTTTERRQASYRVDDVVGNRENATAISRNPRLTDRVVVPRTAIQDTLQHNSNAEFFGGPLLRTRPGKNDTAGANPLGRDGVGQRNSVRGTETPMVQRQPQISQPGLVPGAQNVRNTIALRYKDVAGGSVTRMAAYRGDQPQGPTGSNPRATPVLVSVGRFLFGGGGNQTYFMQRTMPFDEDYTAMKRRNKTFGPLGGARGADIDGSRFNREYPTTGTGFESQTMGQYGVARKRGGDHKRPVTFQEPAPWSTNFYDTTTDIQRQEGTVSGAEGHQPSSVYVSPATKRGHTTQRRPRTNG